MVLVFFLFAPLPGRAADSTNDDFPGQRGHLSAEEEAHISTFWLASMAALRAVAEQPLAEDEPGWRAVAREMSRELLFDDRLLSIVSEPAVTHAILSQLGTLRCSVPSRFPGSIGLHPNANHSRLERSSALVQGSSRREMIKTAKRQLSHSVSLGWLRRLQGSCPPHSHFVTDGDHGGDCACDDGYAINSEGSACEPGIACPPHAHMSSANNGGYGCNCDDGYKSNIAGDACIDAVPTAPGETSALLAAIETNYELLAGWDNASDPCDGWEGIDCAGGHVTKIDFSCPTQGYGLQAICERRASLQIEIGPALSQLQFLTKLVLDKTHLTGNLPPFLWQLPELVLFSAAYTGLSGTLPSGISESPNLRVLIVEGTSVSGTIPPTLGSAPQMFGLILQKTALSGTLPLEIGQMRELQLFGVGSTKLSGTIPSEIGNVTSIDDLRIDSAKISGTLPASINNLSHATTIDLTANRISGTLPSSWSMAKLSILGLGHNPIEGTIPPSFRHLLALTELDLHLTAVTGTLPHELGELKMLKEVFLHETELSGTLPSSITGAAKLGLLLLQSTKLSGTLPSEFGSLNSLQRLEIGNSRISGSLPAEIGNNPQCFLTDLDVHSTLMTGSVPDLEGCKLLRFLDLGSCRFTALPESLPTTLTHCYLDHNPFNASAASLQTLLATMPALRSLEVGFTNVPVVLEPQKRTHFTSRLQAENIDGTRVATPQNCVVGHQCTFLLSLHDSENMPIRVGGRVQNLSLGLDGRRAPMRDEGNGSFSAAVPTEWVKSAGPRLFNFFHGQHEFKPEFDSGGSFAPGADCGSGSSDMLDRECTALRTVVFKPHICPDGSNTVPDSNGSACQCRSGFVPYINQTVHSHLRCHIVCQGMASIALSGSTCECTGNTYDTRVAGVVKCLTEWQSADDADPGEGRCRPCPDCASCQSGVLTLRSGWRLNTTSAEATEDLILRGAERVQFAFRCPHVAYDDSACPALRLFPRNVSMRSMLCLADHTGPLCSLCKDGFSLQIGDNVCVPCSLSLSSTIEQHFGVSIGLLFCILILSVCAIIGLIRLQGRLLQTIKAEVYITGKIVLGLLQVLALLKDVLSIVFPPNATRALNFASLVSIDVHTLIQLDCRGWSWYKKWTLNVLVVPLIVFGTAGIVMSRHKVCNRRSTRGIESTRLSINAEPEHQAASHTTQKKANAMFFAMLLLYPQVSNQILSALHCRQLGATLKILEVNYSVNCDESDYHVVRIVATLLMLAWPIGIPVGLLCILMRQKRTATAHWNAKQNSASTPVDDFETAETLAEYSYTHMTTTTTFCIVQSYRPQCFWYEPVDMLRKLCLSGLLQFFERGTAAQVVVGCVLAFCSFGMQQRLQPYLEPEANTLKALVEAQIFMAFLVSFVLRVLPREFAYEPFGPIFYGWLLLGSLACTLVAAIFLTIKMIRRRRKFRANLSRIIDDQFMHPDTNSIILSVVSPSPTTQLLHSDSEMQAESRLCP